MNKNRIRGKLKGYFFLLKLHNVIPFGFLRFVSQMGELSKWISRHRDTGFSDFYSRKFDYSKRYDLYSFIIETEIKGSPVEYLEFGVSKGVSFRWWADHIKDEKSRFYGFDTFTGLPEDWGSFKKGDMDNSNEIPVLDDPRCKFFQGLFQQTLPPFLNDWSSRSRKIIHMDADLYTSTLFVLTSISHILQKGDIIIFDEFNVPMHEFKAFSEWTGSFYIKYSVIGAVNNFYQIAIRLDQ
jgi:O-methyltransferase